MKTITSATRPARMNAASFAALQPKHLAATLFAWALLAALGTVCILVFELWPAEAAPRRAAISNFANLDAVASAESAQKSNE